jgi:AcrR family transcriptional regulator
VASTDRTFEENPKMVNFKCKKKSELTSEELKAKIISVASHHFARLGLSGVSLKEVAKEADVAGSLINYHFKDKEGLFRACVEPFARDRGEAIRRILSDPQSVEEFRVRIEMFVEEMQLSILKDLSLFEIVDREVRTDNPLVVELFKEVMLSTFMVVQQFFSRAIENKLIRDGLDPVILATLLFTVTCDSARKDHIGKRFLNITLEDPEWRRKFTQHISDLFLKGVMR